MPFARQEFAARAVEPGAGAGVHDPVAVQRLDAGRPLG
jgi:hypothetical protein